MLVARNMARRFLDKLGMTLPVNFGKMQTTPTNLTNQNCKIKKFESHEGYIRYHSEPFILR